MLVSKNSITLPPLTRPPNRWQGGRIIPFRCNKQISFHHNYFLKPSLLWFSPRQKPCVYTLQFSSLNLLNLNPWAIEYPAEASFF
ncbi:hypothetical protein GEZ88_01715 [Streptococcus mitis]|nr:hypothetical protein [Streptococcus mitis]